MWQRFTGKDVMGAADVDEMLLSQCVEVDDGVSLTVKYSAHPETVHGLNANRLRFTLSPVAQLYITCKVHFR